MRHIHMALLCCVDIKYVYMPCSSTWAGSTDAGRTSTCVKSADPGPSTHFLTSSGSITVTWAYWQISSTLRLCLFFSNIATKEKKSFYLWKVLQLNPPEHLFWAPWSELQVKAASVPPTVPRTHQSELCDITKGTVTPPRLASVPAVWDCRNCSLPLLTDGKQRDKYALFWRSVEVLRQLIMQSCSTIS